MEKDIRTIENEINEINKFDNILDQEDVISFSEYCGANLTIICC